jgi:hypothetical protein
MGDPARPQSRYTPLAAVAFAPDEELAIRLNADEDVEDAPRLAATRLFGETVLEEDDVLGRAEALPGSTGRGAEAWAILLLWSASGIVGGAAWDLTKAAARRLRERLDDARARSGKSFVAVSAGTARLLAIAHVLAAYPDEGGPLDTEVIEDTVTIRGRMPPDINYVGYEPWILLLVNAACTFRYLVIVMPDGSVPGAIRAPLTPAERHFGVDVEIPGGTEEERRAARERAGIPETID